MALPQKLPPPMTRRQSGFGLLDMMIAVTLAMGGAAATISVAQRVSTNAKDHELRAQVLVLSEQLLLLAGNDENFSGVTLSAVCANKAIAPFCTPGSSGLTLRNRYGGTIDIDTGVLPESGSDPTLYAGTFHDAVRIHVRNVPVDSCVTMLKGLQGSFRAATVEGNGSVQKIRTVDGPVQDAHNLQQLCGLASVSGKVADVALYMTSTMEGAGPQSSGSGSGPDVPPPGCECGETLPVGGDLG